MSRSTLLYALLSICLVALYAITTFFALHPETSDSYRAYFIDRTREVMDDDGTRLRPVNPGQWIAHDSNDVGYVGFSGVEPELRWTSGRKVAILIDAACGPKWHSVVKIRLSSSGVQRAMFSLNGSARVAQTVQPEQAEISVQFPEGTLKCGHNRLDIELPDARVASAQDSRLLALAFREVTIE
jgi:hypothetical protein